MKGDCEKCKHKAARAKMTKPKPSPAKAVTAAFTRATKRQTSAYSIAKNKGFYG